MHLNAKNIVAMAASAVCLMALTACGPNEQKRANLAELKRVDCLDKVCPGYGEAPPQAGSGEQVMRLNGQWYVAPKPYVKGSAGLAFYWPSKTPVSGRPDGQAYPEGGRDYGDVAIEIFLTHHDGLMYGPNRPVRLQKAEAEGRLISKTTPRPGLEVWRVRETDGLGPAVWYVATAYLDSNPNGAILSCRDVDPISDRCTTGFIWKPGIALDMRLRATHAPDWPEIYQETARILQLLQKV